MTRLEMLNVFVNDRLTAAADDIFRAVKDAVVEYQAELLRSKEENERLKRLLSAAVQRLLLQPEPQSGQVQENGELLEVEQGPVVKVEPRLKGSCVGSCVDEGCSTDQIFPVSRTAAPSPLCIKTEREEPLPSPLHIKTENRESPCGAAEPQPLSPRRTHSTAGPGASLPPSHTPPHSLHKWHSCRQCGKGFSFACQLEVHMRWHTKEKPYCCAVCRKSFTTVSMLKRHHRIHTGEKPFHCHVCGKNFNQSAHLNTHFRLHTRGGAVRSRMPLCK